MINNFVEPQILKVRLKEAWNFVTGWWEHKEISLNTTPIFFNVGLFNLGLLNLFDDAPSTQITQFSVPSKRNLPNPLRAYDEPRLLRDEDLPNINTIYDRSVDAMKFKYDNDH